ncbi:hypothetical protein [Streptomyces sp. NPDC012510]|uniref:hypothetical protein n=1 Tax=Streptomyces sp. NPDC012510 TaxID=3364838 RepID=UPI0036EB3A9D
MSKCHSRARAARPALRETTHGRDVAEKTAATDPVAWAALAKAREHGGDRTAAYDAYRQAARASGPARRRLGLAGHGPGAGKRAAHTR